MDAQNRTTVRPANETTPARLAPRAWRAGLSALDRLAPAVAARVAERLFLTPLPHATPAREREALRDARPFDVPFHGGRLRAWRFGEGPAVLLVHGWSGRGGQMAAFAPALLEAGLSAVTFDGPAHGRSSGRTASVPLFAEAVAAVSAHVGGVRAAIAHSMGAPSITLALLNGLRLDAAVFVGPPRGPVEPLRHFCDAFELPQRLRQAVRARLEARFATPLDEFDLPRLARALTTPLLVIHDRGDAEVAWSEGAAIAEGWPGAALVTTEGLGHSRILRAPEVVARAASFVGEHVRAARCACGRAAQTGRRTCADCALSATLFERSTRWVLAAA
jgi:pimeloyl-ACP methyl ester carboxylesterase